MRPPIVFLCILCASAPLRETHSAPPTVGEQAFLDAIGRDCPVVRLWPDGKVPDEPKPPREETVTTEDENRGRKNLLRISNVFDPSFVVAPPPEKNTGAALLLAPGGGYGTLGAHRVHEIADWMNARGIAVVLLKYRVPKRHEGFDMAHQPLQDAQRALSILRARASEWAIDPGKIGIGGISAGGHLAANLSVNHAARAYEAIDDFDKTSCRPDFAVLLYPAYLTEPVTSRTRDPELNYDRISAKATPPTLIAVNIPDKFTIGSTEYYLALSGAKVSSELHVYPEGGHDSGLSDYPINQWVEECHRFLGDHGIIDAPAPPAPHAYRAAALPAVEATVELTLGDRRLRQLLGPEAITIPLWPDSTGPDETLEPGPETVTHRSRGGKALNITRVTRPTLTISLPPKENRTGRFVLVCPGGGYNGLAAEHEGTRVIRWFNEHGIGGAVLKHVPRRGGDFPKHHHALQDAQRALRILRARASEWNIDPHEVGILGFSAGGHLATTLCTNYAEDHYEAVDAVDEQSARPDFALLVYPAYLTDPVASNEVDPLVKNVRRNLTPPLFTTVARDDKFSRGLLEFYLELQAGRVPAELHVYARGGHGGGLDPGAYPFSEWTGPALRWLGDIRSTRDHRK